jgi:hypothetical protein
MYKVVILVAEPREQKVIMFEKEPTFQDLYPLLDCKTIEIQQCWVDNKAMDMYCDEDSKMKESIKYNEIATDLWYDWQEATGHQCIPGDYIAGNVALIYNEGKSCAVDSKKFGSRI